MKQGEEHNLITSVAYVGHICINCGVSFLITKEFDLILTKTHNNFYCPNGHGQQYTDLEKTRLNSQISQKDKEIKFLKDQLKNLQNKPSEVIEKIKWRHDSVNATYESDEFIIKRDNAYSFSNSVYLKMKSGDLKFIGGDNNLNKAKLIAEKYE